MIRAILDYMGEHVTEDGAWWILGLNSILLIPLIFAVFFFPQAVLIGVAVALVLSAAVVVVLRRARARHRRPV